MHLTRYHYWLDNIREEEGRKSRRYQRLHEKSREEKGKESEGSIRANMNRINSRFNSLKRDPISTITVKLRASALKETT